MQLCKFSKSEIYYANILPTCPLALNTTEAKHCPCRRRLYLPNDLRVLSCDHPFDWRGDRIRDPSAVKSNIQIKIAKSKPPKAFKAPKPKKEKKMTEVATTTTLVPQQSPSTAITIYDRINDPLDFVNKIGATLFNSKMFGCNNIDQGRALAFGFITNKLDPFSWKQRHHIIGGNITMSAEAMLADFRTKTGGEHRIVSRTPDKAAVELSIKRNKQLFEFSWEEAVLEDYVWSKAAVDDVKKRRLPNGELNTALLKDNYSTPRRRMQMLWARVISDGVGAMAPEVSAGQQTPEELGVLGNEIQGEIIDAEFTVSPTVHSASVNEPSDVNDVNNAAAVSDAPSQQTSEAGQPAASTTEAIEAEEAPAVTYKSEPSPVPPPAPGEVQQAAIDDQRALLLELKALKTELLTDDQYQTVLANKYKATSARELALPVLAQLVANLKARKAKQERAGGKDEVSQWANQALAGSGAAAGAPAGN